MPHHRTMLWNRIQAFLSTAGAELSPATTGANVSLYPPGTLDGSRSSALTGTQNFLRAG